MPPLTDRDRERVASAERVAASLLDAARGQLTPTERRRQRQLDALVAQAESRAFLLELTDQVLRIATPRRAARRLTELVAGYGVPAAAGPLDRIGLHAARALAPLAPGPSVAAATARLRRELAGLVLAAAPAPLAQHLRRRRAQGMRVNVNLLGEAVLGERQAAERARRVGELLERPDVDCVSVKLSALYSQLDVVAYDDSLEQLRRRLRPILAAAMRATPPKLVNLDMEEYRDLHLTVDVFTSLLAEAPFRALRAGLALQAYLPDSVGVLAGLADFARRRRAEGGAPVRVRLVKGANLAMERVESELRCWPQAPFETKREVDANYKRLLDMALAPENAGALELGVASHNLFDVAWALERDAETGGGRVGIEMLEGMAPAAARAVSRLAGDVLLYAPVVERRDFESAVAYLVRRFDEHTAPENFLAHLGSMVPGGADWEAQRGRFRRAVADRLVPPAPPRRQATLRDAGTQDAPVEVGAPRCAAPRCAAPGGAVPTSDHPGAPDAPTAGSPGPAFANAPDTDFSVAANREVLHRAVSALSGERPAVHALVDGRQITAPSSGPGIDPSDPERAFYRYVECDLGTVERAVHAAAAAAPQWAASAPAERYRLLHATAERMEASRAHAIAVMMRDGGKTVREADTEVSEAVDDARYYAACALDLAAHHGAAARFAPHGVVVVASPWNFPYAIPAGGVLAALAAGSTVILKPAPEAVLTASLIVAQCHAAGFPPDVVQFVPCADDESGRRLITHPDVGAVVLTGAFDTARRFLDWRPDLALHAETSGKNAIVVTAAADQEDAVRDLVHSAFSHAGQKCSAASLAILEAPVYDDARFLERLADAVSSLRVGPATDLATRMGPLIRPPEGPLLRQLTGLAPGERWLVEPRRIGTNPRLWSPGVKLGVAPASELHLTECFGPVLGIMRARDLDEALALQEAIPYGLTGGISSLDEAEVAEWCDRVPVGNLYVNRHITGAVVGRQPFGGWRRSSIGPGAKAGGPDYVASLGRWTAAGSPDVDRERRAARDAARRLLAGVDTAGLAAERNVRRLRALRHAALRIGAAPDAQALELSLGVARDLGVDVEVSVAAPPLAPPAPAAPQSGPPGAGSARVVVEDDERFLARLRAHPPERVRLVGTAPSLRLGVLDAGADADVEPLVAVGTCELRRWTREQCVSITVHRHGNVLPGRRDPLATGLR